MDWLCFAQRGRSRRLALFGMVGCVRSDAWGTAEGGWATWDALAGTLQTPPATLIGFVSHAGRCLPSHDPPKHPRVLQSALRNQQSAISRPPAHDWLCFAQSTSLAPAPCRDATSRVWANALTGTLQAAPAAPLALFRTASTLRRLGLSGRRPDVKCCVSTEMPLAGAPQISPPGPTGFVSHELSVQGPWLSRRYAGRRGLVLRCL